MSTSSQTHNTPKDDPRAHINEEPRNDLIDVGVGFMVMFGLLFVMATAATIIQVVTK
ncbi:MAG: YqzM family protein [Paenibacillaceae bacterium]|jgi:hypothetical protein|nr:YqzM family protein [Paenibacillaceae bacterium]